MPRESNTYIEYLKLEDLNSAEVQGLIESLRQQDAEFAYMDEHGDFPEEPDRLEITLSAEDALTELRRAEKERRLRVEWKRGWLYFFYSPPISNPDGEVTDDLLDAFCNFVHRTPRKGGPTPFRQRSH